MSERRGSGRRRAGFGLQRAAAAPQVFDPTGSFRGIRRPPTAPVAPGSVSASLPMPKAAAPRKGPAAPLSVLEAYLNDPVDLLEMVKFDDFRSKVCIARTNFEEMEVFSPLCETIDPSVLEKHAPPAEDEDEGEGEVDDIVLPGAAGGMMPGSDSKADELQAAVNTIFLEFLTKDVDRTGPLTSFHMLLFKRLQILTTVQGLHQDDRREYARAKAAMEALPFKVPFQGRISESLAELSKDLEKAMSKKDVRRGLFSKFGTTRYAAIYKALSKVVAPLCLKPIDMIKYVTYLRGYSADVSHTNEARAKTLLSLLYIAIGQGSLSQLLSFLRLLLAYVPNEPFCTESESQEKGRTGIKLGGEDALVLKKFSEHVMNQYKTDVTDSYRFLADKAYALHTTARTVSVEQLFFYVLSRADNVAVHLLYGQKSVADMGLRKLCGGIDFILDPSAETLETILWMLSQVTTSAEFLRSAKLTEDKRDYLVSALLRILRVNLDALTFWKKRDEQQSHTLARMGCPGKSTLFRSIQQLLFQMMGFPGLSRNAFDCCTGIAADSLSVFVPSVVGQKNYVLSILAKVPLNQVEAVVLGKILTNLVQDANYFSWFIIQGVGSVKEDMEDFVKRLLSFVDHHLGEMLASGNLNPDGPIGGIIDRVFQVLLLWHNYLSWKVTPVYSRFQKKANASPATLESLHGKLFLQLTKDVLRYSCAFLAKVAASERCSPENDVFLDAFLKKSFIGKLLFPTMQSMVRLLWKSDQRVKYYLYHLTSFIYTSLLALLKHANKINTVFAKEDPKFEYHILETDHPYVGGVKEKCEARFRQDQALYTAVVFHPRCRTAQAEDNLVISPGATGRSTQPLKFSGFGNTIPVNPLVTWGHSMVLSFTSGQRQTDWGMKCSVLPILRYSWMYELEKCVAWVGGRISTYVMSAFPITDDENALHEWLGSPLFVNGLEELRAQKGPSFALANRFLSDFMAKQGDAAVLVDFIDNRLRMEAFVGRGNEDILAAERAVVAVLLKHVDLVGIAVGFLRKLQLAEDPRDLRMAIPLALLQIWRTVRPLRTWMMQKKQQEEVAYPAVRKDIIEKAKFLIGLQKATFSDFRDSDVAVLLKGGDAAAMQPLIDAHVKVRSDPSIMDNVMSLGQTVLNFVQATPDVKKLTEVMKKRKERALCRHKALDMYMQFISRTQYPTVKAEVLRELYTVLRTPSMKTVGSNDFHYFNNCEGCGFDFIEKCRKSFYAFLRHLIAGDFSEKGLVLSGLVRIILSTCTISFKPSDVRWVIEFDLLAKLAPLLYSEDDSDGEVRFAKKLSHSDEMKELNLRSWKVFRLLSIRCVDMLEDWEAGEKYHLPPEIRQETKERLDAIRDRIFSMVFDNFQKMMRSGHLVESVLVEMLSLLIALSSSEEAQTSFSGKQLRELVVPLVSHSNQKLQQLALKLYTLIVFSTSTAHDDPPEFRDNLISIVASLLGQYQMTQVFGRNPFEEGAEAVGLDLAKECFKLLRRMLRPRSPPEWRKSATKQMEAYLALGGTILELFCGTGRTSLVGLDDETAANIARVLGAFVVQTGLPYVPHEGEYVRARLYGRWEDAKVVFVEESRHNMKIILKKSSGIDRIQRVKSENIRVMSNEMIDPAHLTPSPKIVESFSKIVKLYGKLLFSEAVNEYSEAFHLLFSSLWERSLRSLFDYLAEGAMAPSSLSVLPEIIGFTKTVTPIVYGKELKLHTCTFTFTGKEMHNQYYYPCQTCGLTQDKAVCVFCAMNCHRGHRLGPPKKGEFFCSCGSGAAKFKCVSKIVPPEDPVLSLRRMESLFLRLQNQLPIAASRREQDQSFVSAGDARASQSNFAAPAQWVNPTSSSGYTINKRANEITFTWHSARGFSMIGSDHPVPPIYTGYYFEIEICRRGGRRGGIAIGFSEAVQRNKAWPQVLETSYTLHVLSGHVYRDKTFFQQQSSYSAVSNGDVFGCGWSKDKKSVYFTKNGKMLPVQITNVPPRVYFPVILLRGENAAVRPNLGEKRFRFNVYKSLGAAAASPTTIPTKSVRRVALSRTSDAPSESLKLKVGELRSLGYDEKNCIRALSKYSDLNSAAAYLHRRAMRPVRYQLSDSLVQMGFDRALAIKALEVSNDDVNQALNWLLEEQIVASAQPIDDDDDPGVRQISQNRGVPFLGSNVDVQTVKEEIMKGLVNSYTKVNDNAFPPLPCGHVAPVDSIVVVNPFMGATGAKSKSNSMQLKGRTGVITKKVADGGYVQCVEAESGQFLSGFVSSADMVAVPIELRRVKMDSIGLECIKFNRTIGTIYSRQIIRYYLTHERRIPLDRTFMSADVLYRTLKVLFLEQYHEQSHNFVANVPLLQGDLGKMVSALEECVVESKGKELGFYDAVAAEALKDITMFQEGMPFHRKIIFKNTYNNKRIKIRFWGCSAIFLSFSRRCVLPTQYDYLSFYYGDMGKQVDFFVGGTKAIPRYLVLPGDCFWFEFRTVKLTEKAGFQFHVTPVAFRTEERLALSQPNVALSSLVLRNTSNEFWRSTIALAKQTFEISINYLMTPFAPFKGTVGNAVESLIAELFDSDARPNLNIIKAFRVELEDLFISFKRRSDSTDWPLPIFHSLVELMSIFRHFLSTDLCRSVFPYQDCHHHMYNFRYNVDRKVKDVVTCTSCAMNENLKGTTPRYRSHSFERCGVTFSKSFVWKSEKQRGEYSNLIPIRALKVNPAEWFEHTTWLDQLSIVREVLGLFVLKKPFPTWFLYEVAMETRRNVFYSQTENHPYVKVNGEKEFTIPGARLLYISFDKRSETSQNDVLCFSAKRYGDIDLGCLRGDQMKGKTYIIPGNHVYFRFRCDGGDHKCRCKGCSRPISGIRYHCCSPECDDFDVCATCINRRGLHPETHIFLKIRRPVDWLPASLPQLYTRRWARTSTFRGNVHIGVKCDGCGTTPIVGIRYWCENCVDFNLCSRCAEREYRFHNRHHVFLRIIRPLPGDKSKLPANHLPYGLIYEKDKDIHWGYLFTVTTSEPYLFEDAGIQQIMKTVLKTMTPWTLNHDDELVRYVEEYCGGDWIALKWNAIAPSKRQLMNFPLLSSMPLQSIQLRFLVLKILNRKLARVIHLVNMETATTEMAKTHTDISTLIAMSRMRIFRSIKRDVWDNTLSKTLVEMKPIDLTVNRQVAADAKSSTNKLTASWNTLFNQTYTQLQAMNPKVLARKGAAWKCTFVGEQADDYGGPFRESLSQFCAELQSEQLDLFIRVPNAQHGVGENREKFVPNPRARSFLHMNWYRFIGVLMGVGMLSKNVLSLDLPSIFWKQFVKEKVTIHDLAGIDQMVIQSMENLRTIHLKGVDADCFGDVIMEKFTTKGSDGVEIELVRGGSQKDVTFHNRCQYADLVEQTRLAEFEKQVQAIRDGLFSIVPSRFSPLFTWNDLEVLICGKRTIDLKILRSHTVYEEYKKTSHVIRNFWKVLKSFSAMERSMYLRFVWGRSRLPISEEGFTHPHKIQKLDRRRPDQVLPLSHTCFFSIELPAYSSYDVMREKLLYAITNCRAIDTDATRVAREALNMS